MEIKNKPFKDAVYLGGPQAIPGRIRCAYYDFGGEGVAYHDTDPVNHGSGKLNPARPVIIGPAFWNGIDFLHKLELPEGDPNIIVTIHYYHPMSFTHQGAPWSVQNRDKTGVRWLGTEEEKQAIHKDFSGVQSWAEKHQRTIYLGEFGAYDKADMESRVSYTSFVAREAERQGWGWGYWQFDSDFIAYNISQDQWVEPICAALIPKA